MSEAALTISCEECVFENTSACDDCVVNFLLNEDRHDAIVIDASEARAVRLLAKACLVPGLRYERRVG